MIYTTKQAADALGITTKRIDQLCLNSQLAYTMHGRDRAFTHEEIERYRKQRDGRKKTALRHPRIEPEQPHTSASGKEVTQ